MVFVKMKDHLKINGKLLQINNRFSQLKSNQKDWIATELYKRAALLGEPNAIKKLKKGF